MGPRTVFKGERSSVVSSRMRVALVLGLVMGAFAAVGTASAASDIVISQVYGAGGNIGAPSAQRLVELYNRGPSPVPLGNLSIQYASVPGTGNFGSSSRQLTGFRFHAPAGSVLPDSGRQRRDGRRPPSDGRPRGPLRSCWLP